jgi:dTDP-4-dehydrorhamnose reductase
MNTLIFGSTGFLGATFFIDPPPEFIAVPRQRFDFTKPITSEFREFLHNSEASSAIILSAISSPDECWRDPVGSDDVNTAGTIALCEELKKLGIKPVFFSTDHVFDGVRGQYHEGDRYNPITLYGRQKMATELHIRENFTDYLIMRTSKQVAMRMDKRNTLSESVQLLLQDKPIRCATDNWLSPAFVEEIVEMTMIALQSGLSGIYHIAPKPEYSRLELGRLIADAVGADHTLVVPCSISDFNFPEVRPTRCTLDGSKLRMALQYKMMDIDVGLKRLVSVMRPN